MLWLSFIIGCVHLLSLTFARKAHKHNSHRPNVLIILTDDLGYGDTSVPPFTGFELMATPGLERMASKGTILKNYHTAAATCTPTRASILTGMYPWRMGIKAVFEYGKPNGLSNKNDWLPPLPTIPMVLREANYSVTHSGKWHLGGMRNDDLDLRLLPPKSTGEVGGRRCPHPGPNQQGFKNYVSVLDGPGSPRQNALQLKAQLYSKGCTALRHNDVDIGRGQYNITGFLSYCEAEHAIHAMNISVAKNKPFFINLWFHAPHSPLEEIPGWHERLTGIARNYSDPNLPELDNAGKYRTMVADMDQQVGRVLHNLELLGIERNTLVIFSSDNGPEPFAGSRGGLNGAKRFLYEGGIRVPAIVQWVGTIPAGQVSDMFAVSTDLFPTILDATGVHAPAHLRLDGLSLLPGLIPTYYSDFGADKTGNKAHAPRNELHPVDAIKDDPVLYAAAMRDRVTLWHNDYEGPRRTAAYVYDYKLILNEHEQLSEIFDLQNDLFEKNNLFLPIASQLQNKNGEPIRSDLAKRGTTVGAKPSGSGKVTLEMVLKDRGNRAVHLHIARHVLPLMRDFAANGNHAHQLYLQDNPGWRYPATLKSEMRNDLPQAREPVEISEFKRSALINGTCGATSCSCDTKLAHQVSSLPFERTNEMWTYFQPGKLLNGAELLKL